MTEDKTFLIDPVRAARAKMAAERAERKCLGCQELFDSKSRGIRFCPKCTRAKRKVRLPAIHKSSMGEMDGTESC